MTTLPEGVDPEEVLARLKDLDDDALRAMLALLTPEEVAALTVTVDDGIARERHRSGGTSTHPLLPHQRPPPAADPWLGWALVAGRGAGKTYAAARDMLAHVHGPPCHPDLPGGHRMLIVGPKQSDTVDSCVRGTSGLVTLDPTARLRTDKEGTLVQWPSGAVARIAGAYNPADVESLRAKGGNCRVWMEEVASWRMLGDDRRSDPEGNRNALHHIRLGLRVGPAPRFVASMTPRPRREIKAMLQDPSVHTTSATTDDNPHLPEHIRQYLYDRFGGTRIGRQELLAEMLEDVEGALWDAATIARDRLDPEQFTGTDRRGIVVGVDPPGGATECGIVAVSLVFGGACPCEPASLQAADPRLPHLLVEADRSLEAPPPQWAAAAAELFHEVEADRVAAEVNYGGDMVVSTMATADLSVPVEVVRATRGKAIRAEPMATMAEQGRVHLLGDFLELEDELTTWVPDSTTGSPNRLDAMVWAGTELLKRLAPSQSATGAVASPLSPAGTSATTSSSSSSSSSNGSSSNGRARRRPGITTPLVGGTPRSIQRSTSSRTAPHRR